MVVELGQGIPLGTLIVHDRRIIDQFQRHQHTAHRSHEDAALNKRGCQREIRTGRYKIDTVQHIGCNEQRRLHKRHDPVFVERRQQHRQQQNHRHQRHARMHPRHHSRVGCQQEYGASRHRPSAVYTLLSAGQQAVHKKKQQLQSARSHNEQPSIAQSAAVRGGLKKQKQKQFCD